MEANGIWIHGVSVGEIKSAEVLFEFLRAKQIPILITTTTETGLNAAKQFLKGASAYAYCPIDFSFVVKRWVKAIRPKHFILIESDIWPNLLKALKKEGAQISLVSGKLSERSSKRWQYAPFLAKKIFSYFDQICLQNEEYLSRFSFFLQKEKLQVTGNLKLDLKASITFQTLSLIKRPVVTLSCTHFPEEELLLEALQGLDLMIILAPRHPERVFEVEKLLKKKKIAYSLLSSNVFNESFLLVDTMGSLPTCYAHSDLVILGGSFVDGIGGHNVLEPCLYKTPVFFGPFMKNQKEFVSKVLEFEAGKQLETKQLHDAVDLFFKDPKQRDEMKKNTQKLIESGRGVTAKTLQAIGY